jgi:diacylglycerol kinase (ATP)
MVVYLRYGALVGATLVLLQTLSLSSTMFFVFIYFAAVHSLMVVLFVLRRGEAILGKVAKTGALPLWSYLVWWPFHLVNLISVYLVNHVRKRRGVDLCTEIMPGWHLGGYYSDVGAERRVLGGRLNLAVVDLTTEFPERLTTPHYCLVPIWDGSAPTVAQMRRAADFVAENLNQGRHVVVHCAFGVGRSTTMMIACMRHQRLCNSVDEGLQLIKQKRPVCKLNSQMRAALALWDEHLAAEAAVRQ